MVNLPKACNACLYGVITSKSFKMDFVLNEYFLYISMIERQVYSIYAVNRWYVTEKKKSIVLQKVDI